MKGILKGKTIITYKLYQITSYNYIVYLLDNLF